MNKTEFRFINPLLEEQTDRKHLIIDDIKLKKEIGRLGRYLHDRTKNKYHVIGIMQDLGVIVDTNGLSRMEVINELEEIVCTYRQSHKTARHC